MKNIYYKRALEIKDELVRHRRKIHSYAEVGFELENTVKYVIEELISYGLEPKIVGKSGITCTIGKGDKVILLRGDMDALTMPEETGLDFAATNGNCHSCGHDCHTSMLLGAAKLLKEREAELNGKVKFMFQPAEEILAGANDMVENGILENPKVDAALAIHIAVGRENSSLGEICYSQGSATYSGDAININVIGKDAHGSTPEVGVDAISIASHIVLALQELVSREIPCTDNSIVIVGKISGGTTCNTLAGKTVLECSVRATTPEKREYLKNRIKEISEGTAKVFRGEAIVDYVYGMPPMVNNLEFSNIVASACEEIVDKNMIHIVEKPCGTEDFAIVSEKVPTAYLRLGAGGIDEGYERSSHDPKMILNEDVLPIGAAIYSNACEKFFEV